MENRQLKAVRQYVIEQTNATFEFLSKSLKTDKDRKLLEEVRRDKIQEIEKADSEKLNLMFRRCV